MSFVSVFSFPSMFFHVALHFFLSLDPFPCLSPACINLAERFSAVMDPFSQPCDYFMFSCKAEMSPRSRGRHRDMTISYNATSRDGMKMNRRSDDERQRDKRLPDGQAALFQAIKNILGTMDYNISFNHCTG